ncbi:MAG: hypothetical protein ACYTGP_12000 [Planctomycetota bacterium]|jgi:hypothetical protein
MSRVRKVGVVLIVLSPLVISMAIPIAMAVSTMLATPNVAVDYHREMRARQEALLGIDPAEADAAWARFVGLLDRAATHTRTVSDAWERRARGADFVKRDPYDNGMLDWGFVRQGRTIPAGIEREREAMAAIEADGVFDDVAALVGGPIGLRPVPADIESAAFIPDLPELGQARGLGKALAARMRLAAADGDEELLAASFAQMLVLSETTGHQRTLIDALVGMAISALATLELRQVLDETDVSEEACRRLEAIIRDYRRPPLSTSLEGERALFHDMVQRVFSDDGNGDGHLIPRFADALDADVGAGQFLPALRSRFLMGTRREHVELYDETIDEAIAFTRLPIDERAAAGPPAFRAGDPNEERRLHLVWIMLPAIGKTITQEQSTVMYHRATLIMLAIERFRIRHGRPPATLDELVPEFLAAVPVDPVHGGTFGYRLLTDDPDGRAFELYSFGQDGRDDWNEDPQWRNSPQDIQLNRARHPVEPVP